MVWVACGSCRFRLRPVTAGITSLRHHSNTASFFRRRQTRTLLVNNSFPRVKKRTKMKPGRSVVFLDQDAPECEIGADDPLIGAPVHPQHTDETLVELSVGPDVREAPTASSTVSTKCSKDDFLLLPSLHTLCVVDGSTPPKNLWSLHSQRSVLEVFASAEGDRSNASDFHQERHDKTNSSPPCLFCSVSARNHVPCVILKQYYTFGITSSHDKFRKTPSESGVSRID